MEASTTIREMIVSAKKIIVPSYQRAFSWETPPTQSKRSTHTDVFFADLEEYSQSGADSPYYFGHFLFEKKFDGKDSYFGVVDGQQRLTTIVIFLSVLFKRLKSLQPLSEEQEDCLQDMVKRGSKTRFETVEYDNRFFQDYAIDQSKHDKNGLDTESAKRIAKAFDYFTLVLANKDTSYLNRLLSVISQAACTTHTVAHESEAIQMFIFQNNRGKKPSRLEVIKAQFMHHLHLYSGENTVDHIKEVIDRFEEIYKSIASIGYKIDEDDVLTYTLHVYKNTLSEINATEFINKQLSVKAAGVVFIVEFTRELAVSFAHLKVFFGEDERRSHDIHSLVTLGGISKVLPFILKAYRFDLTMLEKGELCNALESLVLRHRLIGTRAEINTRMNEVFIKFSEQDKSIESIVERINAMKTATEWWWAHWNNEALQNVIQGGLYHSVARFLLWKYENHLRSHGESGYPLLRYDDIKLPELEHIAPLEEPAAHPHGYDMYDDKFRNKYLDCLGNYLLVSKSHNASISNGVFPQKWERYTELVQQREIQSLVSKNGVWDRQLIKQRKQKIVDFIISTF